MNVCVCGGGVVTFGLAAAKIQVRKYTNLSRAVLVLGPLVHEMQRLKMKRSKSGNMGNGDI